jgi:hypothetical protein
MRVSPSIVPPSDDTDTYLVFDDFGRLGRAWRETDEEDTDRQTLLRHLMEGQYNDPVRIVSFNTGEGWSRDVSEDIANDLQTRRTPSRSCSTQPDSGSRCRMTPYSRLSTERSAARTTRDKPKWGLPRRKKTNMRGLPVLAHCVR